MRYRLHAPGVVANYHGGNHGDEMELYSGREVERREAEALERGIREGIKEGYRRYGVTDDKYTGQAAEDYLKERKK